ncbi:MAG: hypothetical protein GY898_28255 [Proteobacteria bacterium]|nr:hypothetical protein [Pseudomonadota bacterium]
MKRASTALFLLLLASALAACTVARRGGGGGDNQGGGEGGDDDDDTGASLCDRMLECVGVVDPEDHADLYAQYGPDGTCWEAGEDASDICNAACEDLLSNYDDEFGDPTCRARLWPYEGTTETGEGWDPGMVLGDIFGTDQYGQAFDVDWLEGNWLLVQLAANPSYWALSGVASQASAIQADYNEELDEGFWVVLVPFGYDDAAEDLAGEYDVNDLPVVQDDSLIDWYDGEDLDTFPGPFVIVEPDRTVAARLTIDDVSEVPPTEEVDMIRSWLDFNLP